MTSKPKMLLKNKPGAAKSKYSTISLAVEPIPEESINEESVIETSMSGSMPNLPGISNSGNEEKRAIHEKKKFSSNNSYSQIQTSSSIIDEFETSQQRRERNPYAVEDSIVTEIIGMSKAEDTIATESNIQSQAISSFGGTLT